MHFCRSNSAVSFVHLLLLLLLCAWSCANKAPEENKAAGYDFAHPAAVLVLPDTLREISGIVALDSTRAACIQDENGILFYYNFAANRLDSQYTFAPNGDYEGIARVGKSIFVLRSDGLLYELPDYAQRSPALAPYSTFIPAGNNEGLCYDPQQHRLLIACKSPSGKGKEEKNRRAIYAFDLTTKKTSATPVYHFSIDSLRSFAGTQEVKLPTKKKKKDGKDHPKLRFRTSAIALHPVTGELYLLSAADHLLFIFDRSGAPLHVVQLDATIFNKPEGITFLAGGDLLITNEAQDKIPTLLRFNYTIED